MAAKKRYKVTSKVRLWSGDMAAWHFAAVGKREAKEIKETHGKHRRGFGSIPVRITVGKTTWKTSIFPDTKSGTYLLPIKASVRKAEDIIADDEITFTLEVLK